MNGQEQKQHWQQVYETKSDQQVSWFQESPRDSLALFHQLSLSTDSVLVDVGAGTSRLAKSWLDRGFESIHVLDISDAAIERSKELLGDQASSITWHIGSVLDWQVEPDSLDLWHDRAVFHFLTEKQDIDLYRQKVSDAIKKGGYLILATFAEDGPLKCSGLPVTRYSIEQLTQVYSDNFELVDSRKVVHQTPMNTQQSFTFCCFRKI